MEYDNRLAIVARLLHELPRSYEVMLHHRLGTDPRRVRAATLIDELALQNSTNWRCKLGYLPGGRALRVAGDDPGILADAAYALGHFGEDIAAALALIDRALELNPSFAFGWQRSGWLRLWAGQSDLGRQHFETSIRFSPRESRAGAYLGIGVAHFFLRRFEEAQAMLLRSLQEKPSWVPTHRFLASCYAQMGRLDEARGIVKRLRNMTAVVVPSATHWRNPQHRDLYLEGLRLAVGEDPAPTERPKSWGLLSG